MILGLLIAPNKFYVISYAAMGLYIFLVEAAWQVMARGPRSAQRKSFFWVVKYLIFNAMFLPGLFFFQDFIFSGNLSLGILTGVAIGGQLGLWIYDQAYEYVQRHLWNKYRGRLLR